MIFLFFFNRIINFFFLQIYIRAILILISNHMYICWLRHVRNWKRFWIWWLAIMTQTQVEQLGNSAKNSRSRLFIKNAKITAYNVFAQASYVNHRKFTIHQVSSKNCSLTQCIKLRWNLSQIKKMKNLNRLVSTGWAKWYFCIRDLSTWLRVVSTSSLYDEKTRESKSEEFFESK